MIRVFSNNIDRTLSGAISDVATTLTLSNATGLHEPVSLNNSGGSTVPPAGSVAVSIPQAEMLTLLGDAGEVEIVKMTARSGNTCTVVRAQEGTTAQAWADGTRVIAASTAGTYDAFLQNWSTHAESIAIDDLRISSRWSQWGYSSADASWSLAIGIGCSADFTQATAVGGLNAYAGAYSTAIGTGATANGEESVSVGTNSENIGGDRTTLVGCLALNSTDDVVVVGHDAYSNRTEAIVVGSATFSQQTGGVAIGRQATLYGNTDLGFGGGLAQHGVAIGYQAGIGTSSENDGFGCVAVGGFSFVGEDASGGVAIGYEARVENSALLGIGLGSVKVETERTCHIGALPAVPRNWDTYTTADAAWAMCAPTTVIMSDVVDLTAVADVTATIWTGLHFFPEEVGLIITAASGVTVQPTVRFGITGTLDKYLAATLTTGLDAAHKRERFETLASADGATSLTAGVTVGATATTLTGRFYWRGFAVRDSA